MARVCELRCRPWETVGQGGRRTLGMSHGDGEEMDLVCLTDTFLSSSNLRQHPATVSIRAGKIIFLDLKLFCSESQTVLSHGRSKPYP